MIVRLVMLLSFSLSAEKYWNHSGDSEKSDKRRASCANTGVISAPQAWVYYLPLACAGSFRYFKTVFDKLPAGYPDVAQLIHRRPNC